MLKKILIRGLFVLVCLVTLIALAIAVENWRAKRAWERCRAELEARGEILDLAKLAPPPVPDDQNFAMTPLLKPLFPVGVGNYYGRELDERLSWPGATNFRDEPGLGDWRMGKPIDLTAWQKFLGNDDILQALTKLDPELNEISETVHRPYSRFPVGWDEGVQTLLPHLNYLRKLARIYTLRASVALETGRPDRATTDVETVLRLADTVRDEPILISQLVRVAIITGPGLAPIWSGLVRHQWSDTQLTLIQRQLQQFDFIGSGQQAFRGERAMLTDTLERATRDRQILAMVANATGDQPPSLPLSKLPRFVLHRNLITAVRFYDEHLLAGFQPAEHRVDPRKAELPAQQLTQMRITPYTVFAKLLLPSLGRASQNIAAAQTAVDEAAIACALERYRLANGQLPENLASLVPQFIDKLPHDVITGQPLHYRRLTADTFVLYSVGWNQTDDGGVIAKQSNPGGEPRQDFTQGDWPWPQLTAP